MTTAIIANLEKLIDGPRDGALLRYSLGNEWLKAGEPVRAAECLRAALARDAHYTAAWKLLGKALSESGDEAGARQTYARGIEIAEARGDLQAAKEMRVFLRRLDKNSATGGTAPAARRSDEVGHDTRPDQRDQDD